MASKLKYECLSPMNVTLDIEPMTLDLRTKHHVFYKTKHVKDRPCLTVFVGKAPSHNTNEHPRKCMIKYSCTLECSTIFDLSLIRARPIITS